MAEYAPDPSYASTEPGTLAVRKAVLGKLLVEEPRPVPPPKEQPLIDTGV